MIFEKEDGVLMSLKLIPNSKKTEIIIDENSIKIRVTAQPIENKANKALLDFLSKFLKIPKSKIQIVRGQTSKEKTLLIKDTTIDYIENKLKD
jgi:uncharacterized protein (TIGR00251 family)